MSLDLGLQGKIAVVTGAGGAICGAIAEALAGQESRVAIWDISEPSGTDKCEQIRSRGGEAISIVCDATDPDSVAAATERTLKEFGTITKLSKVNSLRY